jgi:hypothetical protein
MTIEDFKRIKTVSLAYYTEYKDYVVLGLTVLVVLSVLF